MDVERSADVDAEAVESFAVEYEPGTRLSSYEVSVTVVDGPGELAGGVLAVEGGCTGATDTPDFGVEASAADPPDGADLIPASEIDDECRPGT